MKNKTLNHYIGIDPGKKGGLCILNNGGEIVEAYAFAEYAPPACHIILPYIRDTLLPFPPAIVAIEKPKIWNKAHKHLTELIRDAGIWEGYCLSLDWPIITPEPNEWQALYKKHLIWEKYKAFPASKIKTKRSYDLVKDIFDNRRFSCNDDEYAKTQRKKVDEVCLGKRGGIKDGVTDAILIANWVGEEIWKGFEEW